MMVKSGAAWIGAGLVAGLVAGAFILAMFGAGERGVSIAVRAVARVAFVFFWLTYTGGALAALFGPRFAGLMRLRRELGLAFAAALLVHLALVAWLFRVSAKPPITEPWLAYFVVGALCAGALALASAPRFGALWGSRIWRVFSMIALEYIAFLFFRDLVLVPLQVGTRHPLQYAPFALLIIVGPPLRWVTLARRRRGYAPL